MMHSQSTILPATSSRAAVPMEKRAHYGSLRRYIRLMLAGLFAIALIVPLLGLALHWDFYTAASENRKLAVEPGVPKSFAEARSFGVRWMAYFRDHFGLRNTLIHGVAVVRARELASQLDVQVLVGQQGWLYLRPDGDRDFIAFRGLNPLTDKQLDAWQNVLEKRNAWLASQGIPYLVVIPPDKSTIYPEYLPREYQPVRKTSRLDQLLERLRQTHSPVHVVDLRAALLAAKSTHQVFMKTDTHWNSYGAFVAYGQIIREVQKLIPKWHIVPLTMTDMYWGIKTPENGDLARMTDTPDQYQAYFYPLFCKKHYYFPPKLIHPDEMTLVDSHDSSRPNLIIYRDSFTIALAPFLQPNFNQVAYVFRYALDPDLITLGKPDLVISEFLERNLFLDPPTDPPDIRNFASR